MAEWSIAAVLKTVDLRGSGGSNPSLSAKANRMMQVIRFFYCPMAWHACMPEAVDNKKMMCRKAHLVCFKAPPRRAGVGMPTTGRPNPPICREYHSPSPRRRHTHPHSNTHLNHITRATRKENIRMARNHRAVGTYSA